MRLNRDGITFWIDYLTIELFIPRLLLQKKKLGIIFTTDLLYQDRTYKGWYPFGPSFVFRVLGFGFGLSWKHTDNPKMKGYDYGY